MGLAETNVLSNLHAPEGGIFSYSSDGREAIGIRTGDVGLFVSDITLRLQASSPSTFTVSLYSAEAEGPYFLPASPIASFDTVDVLAKANYTFVPLTSAYLSPNTYYWIVSQGVTGSGWSYVEAHFDFVDAHTSDFGVTIHDYAFIPDGDTNWNVHSGADYIGITGSIPEPASSAFLLGIFTGTAIIGRRRTCRSLSR